MSLQKGQFEKRKSISHKFTGLSHTQNVCQKSMDMNTFFLYVNTEIIAHLKEHNKTIDYHVEWIKCKIKWLKPYLFVSLIREKTFRLNGTLIGLQKMTLLKKTFTKNAPFFFIHVNGCPMFCSQFYLSVSSLSHKQQMCQLHSTRIKLKNGKSFKIAQLTKSI